MKRSYRFEQGFTYELHVAGVADEQRAAFVEKRDADTVDGREATPMADKRLDRSTRWWASSRTGMTIGFGGWGSRRKPMAAVRAILRSGIGDLTVVSYGGPDVGLLCAAGKVKRWSTAS